uniref:Cation/H(+) antiporter 15-like n=2 Tax=Cicer arietinum TaxID=3827 RepID=A0A3Q7XMA2_CICAR|nr:cation/H(+) antiporter 15-like [Cicer arietinum]
MIIETSAAFGVMFYFFIIGVKMDPASLLKHEKKAMTIGLSVFTFTMAIPTGLSMFMINHVSMNKSLSISLPLIALSQSFTAFVVIAILLTELKILNTDIGRLAMSAAMFCDIAGFILTTIIFALMQNKGGNIVTFTWIILSIVTLFVGIIYVMRPILIKISKKFCGEKLVREWFIICIYVFVLITGFFSEIIGQHYIMGPLLLGLAIPVGPPLGTNLITKMETLCYDFFYPTYLAISGLETNLFQIDCKTMWIVCTVVTVSVVVKIGAVILSGYYNNIPLKECFVIGLILNAKGISELVVYNLWKGNEILSEQEFSLAVFSIIVINAIITPLVKVLYDPTKQNHPITRSSIQHTKEDLDFHIMVCIHKHENIPTMMNLLEASDASAESNVRVIALILVELIGRSRPLLFAHQPHNLLRYTASKSTHINNAFHQYVQQNKGYASVELFTSISNYETMSDDVFRIAIDRIANILILPFHKKWEIDGSVEITKKSIQYMNIKVLEMAPCSVGILVDRGSRNTTQLFSTPTLSSSAAACRVGVFFIGGLDDIEALAYSSRMSRHENVKVTVVRYLQFGSENSIERRRESDLIDEYRHLHFGNRRFKTIDEVMKDGIEMSVSIRKWIDCFDLVMVGREHSESALLKGYEEWSECPELGLIGDMLASQDFETKASVLVVQQQRLIQRTFAKSKICPMPIERDRKLHYVPFDMQLQIDEKLQRK